MGVQLPLGKLFTSLDAMQINQLALTGGFTLRWDEIVDACRSEAHLEPRLIAEG